MENFLCWEGYHSNKQVLSIVLIDGTLRCDGEEDVVDHNGMYRDYMDRDDISLSGMYFVY